MTRETRELTDAEHNVLLLIQEICGEQNAKDAVFFIHDLDEAAIFIKDKSGSIGMCANLTNLAAMRADGTIASEDELKQEWLIIDDT